MQPGSGKNYFELFELPEQFQIDLVDLNGRYRKLQQQFHPDRYAAGSAQERRIAMELTASINEGLRVLKDPVSRGRYLLELSGIPLNDETDTVMAPAFLMEQMELREQLESVRDADNKTAALLCVSGEVEQAFNARIDRLKHELGEQGDKQLARNIIRELQFLQKLKMQIEQMEEDLV